MMNTVKKNAVAVVRAAARLMNMIRSRCGMRVPMIILLLSAPFVIAVAGEPAEGILVHRGPWYWHSGDAVPPGDGRNDPAIDPAEWRVHPGVEPPLVRGVPRLWLRTELPHGTWRDPVMLVQRVDQLVEVWCGGISRYRFGTLDNRMDFAGSPAHLIPLGSDCIGGPLYLRVYSAFGTTGLAGVVIVGARFDVVRYLVRMRAPSLVLGGLIIFLGIASMVVFFLYSDLRHFLSMGILSIAAGVYFIAQSRVISFFFDAPLLLTYAQFLALYLLPVGSGMLIDHLFSPGWKGIIRKTWQFFFVFAIGAFAVSFLPGWSIVSVLIPFEAVFIPAIVMFVGTMVYYSVKGNTEARIIMVGLALAAILGIVDLLSDLNIVATPRIAAAGFAAFSIAVVAVLARRLVALQRSQACLNRDLQARNEALDEANRRIGLSEEKYRRLVEGTTDIIFSLDADWRVISVNRAVHTHFNITPGMMNNRDLLEYLYDTPGQDVSNRQLVQEKLENFRRDRRPISFSAPFKTPMAVEPKEMLVRLEYVTIEGIDEIIGKAVPVTEDLLLRYFEGEEQRYRIENYLFTADDVSHRITRNLGRYLPAVEVSMIRLGIREIIINAIEHGNLEISYEEKTGALETHRYFHLLEDRQKNPVFSGRRVTIEAVVDGEKARYRIADEGRGFDHARFMAAEADDINTSEEQHGRGIIISRSVFDVMEYSERGNDVVLTKYLK